MAENAFDMANRLRADTVWKTVNLVRSLDWGVVSYLVDTGLTPRRMPVDDVDLIGRVNDAFGLMLANPDHPLDAVMAGRFAQYAGGPASPPSKGGGEEGAISSFLALQNINPVLGALYANHILLHDSIGQLGIPPKRLDAFRKTLRNGSGHDFLKDEAIELAPGGLTRAKRRRYDQGHTRALASA